MKTPAIMVLGTGSHVGKSLLTAALCRLFRQSGYRVAPFKSQNMSLNSAATMEGLEIGRAQALQAQAAGLLPSVHMNPILIKPSGDASSQIVVRGKIWKNLSASDYHLRRVEQLMPIVEESYRILASEYELVILEGAGSPAEINLKKHDIANMRMAELADAKCILVGDIDRGGVFASLLGTLELLDQNERARIRGFVINKFRGDLDLLLPGIEQIEQRIDKPCLGVVTYLHDLALDEEDSVALDARKLPAWTRDTSPARPLRIAVIAVPSLANFTDFDPLMREASVFLKLCRAPDDLTLADIVILPGSKKTVQDLQWLRAKGFDEALLRHTKNGGLTVGICGGLQMLGQEICDPDGIEAAGSASGLGLLPVRTRMRPEKITVNASGRMLAPQLFGQAVNSKRVQGYEIHVGETNYLDNSQPFAILDRETEAGCNVHDGCVSEDQRTFGTYLHGIFDDDGFRHAFLEAARAQLHLAPADNLSFQSARKQQDIDRLAEAVGHALDMKSIFNWVRFTYNEALENKTS